MFTASANSANDRCPERDAEPQRGAGLDPPRRQRAPRRARHARVDVALDVVVDRAGAAGGQVAADQRREQHAERRRGVGDEHGRRGGHQQQRDDARLRERDVVGRPARARRRARMRLGAGGPPRAGFHQTGDRLSRASRGAARRPATASGTAVSAEREQHQRDPQQRAARPGGRRSATRARRPTRSRRRAAPARSGSRR